MKTLPSLALILSLSLFCFSSATAGNRAVNGLLIGAGSGAIIGHVAGQNPESVLIGSAVGGAIGYAIGRDQDRPDRIVVHDSYRPVYHYNQYPVWRYDHHKPHYRDDHRNRHWDRQCRESVSYKKHHGKITRIVKTTCNRPYRHDWDRHRYRHDRDDD